jgi:hypothetical protein
MSGLNYLVELLERSVYRFSPSRRRVLGWVINYYFRQDEITVYCLALCSFLMSCTVIFPVLRHPLVYGLAGLALAGGLLGLLRPLRAAVLWLLAWLISG